LLRWLRSPRLLVYLALSLTLVLSLLLPPGSVAAQTPIQQASAPQTLNFVNGVAVVQGTAGFNQPQVYLFFGAQGQNIRVQLSSQPAGANFEVASQDNNTVYKSFADPSLDWSYVLPASQNYRVTINSVAPVVFTLTVTLGSGGGGGGAQRINFAPGQTSAQVNGTAGVGQSPQYVFFANGGQQVRIVVISPGNIANFGVTGVTDGVTYKSPTDQTRDWTFMLPTSQDYQITVSAGSSVNFTLQVFLLNPQPPQTERITFAPGQSSQVKSGNLQANVPKYYVVYVAAGQQLRLLLTSNPAGSANFAINGVSDGIVYKQLTDPSRETTITAPTSQDYLITVFSSVNASYQLEVTVPTPLPPTFQPTLTPLPTLPSGCTTNTIQNGGFETDGFWIFGDTQVKPVYSSTVVHSGLRSARLGIDPAMGASFQNVKSFSSVRQPFQIPIEASIAQLRWWSYYGTQEAQTDSPGLGQDKQEVVLLKPDLSTVAVVASVRRNNNAWIEQMFDLTPYRGQSLVLYFNVYNDGNGQVTWQYLDDVAINMCFPAVTATPVIPTAIPLPTAIASPLVATIVNQAIFPTSPAVATFIATTFPTLAALVSPIAGKGEPQVVTVPPGQAPLAVAAAQLQSTNTPPPPIATAVTEATTQGGLRIFNRPAAEVLTWLGIMLGAVAVIGILAALIWQAAQHDETIP
jgi:hypothetical protein